MQHVLEYINLCQTSKLLLDFTITLQSDFHLPDQTISYSYRVLIIVIPPGYTYPNFLNVIRKEILQKCFI